MKIRYTLIIAILAAALGYGCAPAIAHHENTAPKSAIPIMAASILTPIPN